MPGGRSGLDLAGELRRHRPDLPVVLATGYAEAAPSSGHVLAKPYRLDELTTALLEALKRTRSA